MNTINPLENLKDIHLPSAISWWPPAPGWWILGIIILSIFIFIIIVLYRIYKRRIPKVEALRILKNLRRQSDKNNNELKKLRELSQLLRRTALSIYTQEEVASLHGTEWLEFLDKTGQTNDFTEGHGKIFGEDIFKLKPKFDLEALFLVVSKWLNKCSYQT